MCQRLDLIVNFSPKVDRQLFALRCCFMRQGDSGFTGKARAGGAFMDTGGAFMDIFLNVIKWKQHADEMAIEMMISRDMKKRY